MNVPHKRRRGSPRSFLAARSMVSLKLQKRLAASVLGCGLRKVRRERVVGLGEADILIFLQVWLDPNEVNEISMANSSE